MVGVFHSHERPVRRSVPLRVLVLESRPNPRDLFGDRGFCPGFEIVAFPELPLHSAAIWTVG